MNTVFICTFILFFTLVHSSFGRIPARCCNSETDVECRPRCLRKNYKSLTDNDWKNLGEAFQAISTPVNGQPSILQQIGKEHSDNFNKVHNEKTQLFFSYHSMLLAEIEMHLYKTNKVCLPYWDYPSDTNNILNVDLFSENKLGPITACNTCWEKNNAFPGFGFTDGCIQRCIMESQDAYMQMILGSSNGQTADAFMSPAWDWDYMNRTKSIMNPHKMIHFLFRGTMIAGNASKDPAFYFLHTFVEKNHAESLSSSRFLQSMKKFGSEPIPVYDKTIEEFYQLEYCYNYEGFKPIHEPGPTGTPNGITNTPTIPNISSPTGQGNNNNININNNNNNSNGNNNSQPSSPLTNGGVTNAKPGVSNPSDSSSNGSIQGLKNSNDGNSKLKIKKKNTAGGFQLGELISSSSSRITVSLFCFLLFTLNAM